MMPELSHCDLYFKRCVKPEDLKPQLLNCDVDAGINMGKRDKYFKVNF
jgi:hypothetical protein